jgi:cytidine deaminase
MVAGGETEIAEILVLGPGPERIAPCGACRQRIAEFASEQTLVHSADGTGAVKTAPLSDLLPNAFGPASLRRG